MRLPGIGGSRITRFGSRSNVIIAVVSALLLATLWFGGSGGGGGRNEMVAAAVKEGGGEKKQQQIRQPADAADDDDEDGGEEEPAVQQDTTNVEEEPRIVTEKQTVVVEEPVVAVTEKPVVVEEPIVVEPPKPWFDSTCRKVPKSPHATCGKKKISFSPEPLECIRWGTEYGGPDMPTALCALNKDSIVYGFGIGEDMSYDLSLASVTGGTVHMFDPTPRAKIHIDAVMHAIKTGKLPAPAPGRGPTYFLVPGGENGLVSESSATPFVEYFTKYVIGNEVRVEQFAFHPWGLWDSDAVLQFTLPKAGVSGSLVGNMGSTIIDAQVFMLETIMKKLGHDHVDVLKFDIEGAELRVIPALISMFKSRYGSDVAGKSKWPKMLLFDLDSSRSTHPAYNAKGAANAVKLLRDEGYVVFSDAGGDYVMIRQVVVV